MRQWQVPINNSTKIAGITFFSSFYIYSHVGTLYLQEWGLNLLQVNSIWSIIVGTIFVVEVPTGIIADKIGYKRAIIAAMAFQMVGEFLYLFSRSYGAFVLLAVIAGIGFAFLSGCVEALVYETLTGPDRELEMKKAMGLKGLAFQLAFFAAPIVGSFLIPTYTQDRFLLAVFLTGCSVGVALLIACTLEEPQHQNENRDASSLEIFRQGLAQLKQHRQLRWFMLLGVFTATFSAPLINLYQPYFAQFEIETFWMGIAFAVGALIAGFGERYVYLLEGWIGPSRALLITAILPGLCYLLFGLATHPGAVMLLFICTYGTTTLKDPLLSAYQNRWIESENRATVLSFINLLNSLYVALMTLVMGWLADINLSYGFLLIGLVIIVATLLLRIDRHMK